MASVRGSSVSVLADGYAQLAQDLAIPTSLEEVGIQEKDLELLSTEASKIERLLQNNMRMLLISTARHSETKSVDCFICPTIVYCYSPHLTQSIVKSPVLAYWNLIWLAFTLLVLSDKNIDAEYFVATIRELKVNALVFMLIFLITYFVDTFSLYT